VGALWSAVCKPELKVGRKDRQNISNREEKRREEEKLELKIRTDRKSTIWFLLCLENRYNIELCKIHETQP
jgi:hypothetical protein